MSPRRVITKMIGELLIERGIITPPQLKQALEEQRKKGGYVSQHLITLGFAKETDIAGCLASQYDFAYIPLGNYEVPEEILKLIPFKLINIYSILPIDKMGDVLSVVMADPLNDGVIDMLKQIVGMEIAVFISTYGEIRNAIEKYFADKLKEPAPQAIEEDILKENIVEDFIQVKGYAGQERRRYKRIDVDLDMTYFMQDRAFKAKVKNISYNGILFICDSFISIDKSIYANIVCKMSLTDVVINSVVQVIRVENMGQTGQLNAEGKPGYKYNIAGFFNFMAGDDRRQLAQFLKGKIAQPDTEELNKEG